MLLVSITMIKKRLCLQQNYWKLRTDSYISMIWILTLLTQRPL